MIICALAGAVGGFVGNCALTGAVGELVRSHPEQYMPASIDPTYAHWIGLFFAAGAISCSIALGISLVLERSWLAVAQIMLAGLIGGGLGKVLGSELSTLAGTYIFQLDFDNLINSWRFHIVVDCVWTLLLTVALLLIRRRWGSAPFWLPPRILLAALAGSLVSFRNTVNFILLPIISFIPFRIPLDAFSSLGMGLVVGSCVALSEFRPLSRP